MVLFYCVQISLPKTIQTGRYKLSKLEKCKSYKSVFVRRVHVISYNGLKDQLEKRVNPD